MKSSNRSGPVVRCPICTSSFRWNEHAKWRPFCSERCRTLDTAAWASDTYRIPGPPVDPMDHVESS